MLRQPCFILLHSVVVLLLQTELFVGPCLLPLHDILLMLPCALLFTCRRPLLLQSLRFVVTLRHTLLLQLPWLLLLLG